MIHLQILCHCVWVLAFVNRFTSLRHIWERVKSQNSVNPTISYFNLAHALIHLILHLTFFWAFHKERHKIIDLLNLISKSRLLDPTSRPNSTLIRRCLMSILIIWSVLIFAAPILGYGLICSYNWNINHLLNAHVSHARYTFFLTDKNPFNTIDRSALLSHTDKFLCALHIFISVSHIFVISFITLVFGNCTAIMWEAASSFKDLVNDLLNKDNMVIEVKWNECNDENCNQGVTEQHAVAQPESERISIDHLTRIRNGLTELENISAHVNGVWNMLIFVYMLDSVAWLSTDLDFGLRTKDWFLKIHKFYYWGYLGLSLLFSGETFRKVIMLNLKYIIEFC